LVGDEAEYLLFQLGISTKLPPPPASKQSLLRHGLSNCKSGNKCSKVQELLLKRRPKL
jgi:hypothetical protein